MQKTSYILAKNKSKEVTLKGKRFNSAKEVIAYLKYIKDKKKRYNAQIEILKAISKHYSKASNIIKIVFKYI